jgi:hypothetical protein
MKKTFAILALVAMLLTGMAGAVSYTAITKVASLDDLNDYAKAPGSWDTLLGNGSINYYAWPEGYDVIVGFNYTSSTNSTYDHFDIMAGDEESGAFRAALGNFTITAPSGIYFIGPLESARFMNETGYLQISSGYMAGKVAIIKTISNA